ncbi:MAG: hypothetical protein AB1512_11550 [Thermodesulfobacteriota bacterium]
MEIIASYWEPRIRTYGFQKVTDLSLVEVTPGKGGMESLGLALSRLGEWGIDFQLVFSCPSPEKPGISYLLTARHADGRLSEFIGQGGGSSPEGMFHVVSPVELVLFQGPHYGDRFGIVDASLQALIAKGLGIVASVCSGSCVYLVVPEGKADDVIMALSDAFEVPKAAPRCGSKPAATS